ncbi:MAG TPA: hypothetical protein DCZ04_03110 [Syntrophorhabdus aromaticivorans]|nr:hypothetical protein [Syntrophorhabdus aromaticivorans]
MQKKAAMYPLVWGTPKKCHFGQIRHIIVELGSRGRPAACLEEKNIQEWRRIDARGLVRAPRWAFLTKGQERDYGGNGGRKAW